MASQLTFADGSFSPVSTCFPDKYNSSRYQREVVNRAIKAGCDSLQCPVMQTHKNNYKDNYDWIKSRIAGFSAQLDEKCKDVHPEIFCTDKTNDLPDPLAGLKEWIRRQRSYHSILHLDAGQAWRQLSKQLEWTDAELDTDSIKTWVADITTAQNSLLRTGVAITETDVAIVTSVLEKLQLVAA